MRICQSKRTRVRKWKRKISKLDKDIMDKTSATLKRSKFSSLSLRKSSGKSLVNKMYVKRRGPFTRHCWRRKTMEKRGHLRGVLHKLKRKGLTPKYQFSGPTEKKRQPTLGLIWYLGSKIAPNNRTVLWLRILIHVKITFTTKPMPTSNSCG